MRKLWLVAMLAGGCASSGDDRHSIVDCKGYTVNGAPFTAKCELACENADPSGAPPQGTGPMCTTKSGDICGNSFDFDGDGIYGCCMTDIADQHLIRFDECR